jgi:transposase-like protein
MRRWLRMGKRGKAPGFSEVCCLNEECELYGRVGKANIVSNGTYETQSGRVRKFICRNCGKVFNERTGTFFFDLRTPKDKVIMALKLLLKGVSVRGIADVLDSKPDTVLSWLHRAAKHSQEIEDILLGELKVSKVELDELWTFVQKKRLRAWKKKRANLGARPRPASSGSG